MPGSSFLATPAIPSTRASTAAATYMLIYYDAQVFTVAPRIYASNGIVLQERFDYRNRTFLCDCVGSDWVSGVGENLFRAYERDVNQKYNKMAVKLEIRQVVAMET